MVLYEITNENESVGWVVSSPDGLTRIDGDDRRRVDIRVVAVVTDRRFLFLSGAEATATDATDAGSIAYDEVAAAYVSDGVLELSTVDGVAWRFPVADADPAVVDALGRHVAWIGDVRGRVVACRNDVELAASEIRDAAAAMDWDAGEATYERGRETLNDVLGAVQRTEHVPDDVLAPDLTAAERALERAYATLSVARADSRLTLARQLVENEAHEQARDILESVLDHHGTARSHAATARRSDDFAFGEQRELGNRLERLESDLEAVASAPLRQAREAAVDARATDDSEKTVECWETAFRRYRDALALLAGDFESYLDGDVEAVREQLSNVAGQLVGVHQALARNRWDEGVGCHREDDTISAIMGLDAAVDHLSRAHEVAAEFRPDAADDLASRLEKMEEGLRRVRATGTGDRTTENTPERTESDEQADETAPTGDGRVSGITASELAEIDTHVEIAFTDPVIASESGTNGADEPGEDGELVLHGDGE